MITTDLAPDFSGITDTITEEHVNELAKTGSIQLDPACMPPDPEKLLEFAGSRYDPEFGHRPARIAELDIVFPAFRSISARVLSLAGYDVADDPGIRITHRKIALANEEGFHRDFEAYAFPGFSYLCSWTRKAAAFNRLITAGRDERPDNGAYIHRYEYSAGPILIAQDGFIIVGQAVMSVSGKTWHKGDRKESTDAGFVAIDYQTLKLPQQG